MIKNPEMTLNKLELGPGERIDDLGIAGYKLVQNPDYFCFGMDAVLLSSFAKVHEGESVLDMCSGNGIIPVLLAAKTKAEHIYGLEIQKAPFELALKSLDINNLNQRITMIQGDVKVAEKLFSGIAFDVITVNPPYIKGSGGVTGTNTPVTNARHEVLCTFQDILTSAYSLLKPKGRIYIVHRPLRLVELLSSMSKNRLEPKTMRLVFPYRDREPNLVLIEGIKDAGGELRIGAPLVVYDSPGNYTPEVLKIYGYE